MPLATAVPRPPLLRANQSSANVFALTQHDAVADAPPVSHLEDEENRTSGRYLIASTVKRRQTLTWEDYM
jgi:hypothetical protein